MARPNWEYVRVDVLLPSHPKLDGLSPAAKWTLMELWCHCGQHLTDGFVRDPVWRKTGTAAQRAALVAAGLAERADGGWQMHDYLEHQRSRAEVIALKAKRAEAGRKGGNAKASATANASPVDNLSGPPGSPVDNSGSRQNSGPTVPRAARILIRDSTISTGANEAGQNGSAPGQPPDGPWQVPQHLSSKSVAEAEAEAEAEHPVADVINRANGSSPEPSQIERLIINEIRETTGRDIDAQWAAKIQRHILDGRTPADPAAYIRRAIRNDPDPRRRFLPIY